MYSFSSVLVCQMHLKLLNLTYTYLAWENATWQPWPRRVALTVRDVWKYFANNQENRTDVFPYAMNVCTFYARSWRSTNSSPDLQKSGFRSLLCRKRLLLSFLIIPLAVSNFCVSFLAQRRPITFVSVFVSVTGSIRVLTWYGGWTKESWGFLHVRVEVTSSSGVERVDVREDAVIAISSTAAVHVRRLHASTQRHVTRVTGHVLRVTALLNQHPPTPSHMIFIYTVLGLILENKVYLSIYPVYPLSILGLCMLFLF